MLSQRSTPGYQCIYTCSPDHLLEIPLSAGKQQIFSSERYDKSCPNAMQSRQFRSATPIPSLCFISGPSMHHSSNPYLNFDPAKSHFSHSINTLDNCLKFNIKDIISVNISNDTIWNHFKIARCRTRFSNLKLLGNLYLWALRTTVLLICRWRVCIALPKQAILLTFCNLVYVIYCLTLGYHTIDVKLIIARYN